MFSTRLHSATIRDVVAGSASKIVADFVCSAEDAIIRARDCVHERRVITDDRAGKTLDSRHDCDLTAMRLEIVIADKLARADSCAIDHEVEFCIDIFELFEVDVRMDFAASLAKARGEVIEINRSVHQRNAQRETTLKAVVTALCVVLNRPQAGCYR